MKKRIPLRIICILYHIKEKKKREEDAAQSRESARRPHFEKDWLPCGHGCHDGSFDLDDPWGEVVQSPQVCRGFRNAEADQPTGE